MRFSKPWFAPSDDGYSDALNSRVLDGSQMQPGRVYVGRLPGHSGPVFVRRRKKSFCSPFGVPSVTSIFAPPAASPMECHCNTATICQPQPPLPVFIAQPSAYTTPPQVLQPPPYLQLPPPPPVGTTTTTTTTHQELQPQQAPAKHTCAACGKFRSARYQYRHPLAPGETPRPTLCRKCIKQHTSSEELDEIERARWKRRERETRRQKHRQSYSSDEWSSSSSHEERRRHHRYRSSNETRRHQRNPQSSSCVSTRIYIFRPPEERRRPRSSSDSVRIIRRVRTSEDQPRPFLRSRQRYGPFDGHHSYEEYYSDERVEADDSEHRGRSRSRSSTRYSIDGSHSISEDYVRISTSVPRRRRLGLLDRLSRSRSRSSSRSRWRRDRSDHFEEESVRISIRSREPSPLTYERYEHEYEERTRDPYRSPWCRGSESMLMQRNTMTLETRSDDYFDRHRYQGRPLGLEPPTRSVRIVRARSPSILRRHSFDHGMRDGRKVRFARSQSTSSHRESHDDDRGFHHSRRRYRRGYDPSYSSGEENHAGMRQVADFMTIY